MIWGISYDMLALWVYLGMMPIVFIPIVRYIAGGDNLYGDNEALFMVSLLVVVLLLAWPVLVVGCLPVIAFGRAVRYVANYERKTVERSS